MYKVTSHLYDCSCMLFRIILGWIPSITTNICLVVYLCLSNLYIRKLQLRAASESSGIISIAINVYLVIMFLVFFTQSWVSLNLEPIILCSAWRVFAWSYSSLL